VTWRRSGSGKVQSSHSSSNWIISCAAKALTARLARVQADRLMTAYQEDLLSLDRLRRRMPELRKQEKAIGGELSAIQSQLADRAGYLRLAETITSFLARLRATAKTLDVSERQRIVRLLVKEVLVSNDAIVIRHSIPAPIGSPAGGGPTSHLGGRRPSLGDPSYLLRTGSNDTPLRPPWSLEPLTLCLVARLQHLLNELQHAAVGDLLSEEIV
jgi:site-specific DNA recombinase